MIVVYDCIFVCLIFHFKTGVKLKWGCMEPLILSYFWRLGKTAENSSVILSAVFKFLSAPTVITAENYFHLPPKVIVVKNNPIFTGHPQPLKVTLFLAN
jgi:hypothetical protein